MFIFNNFFLNFFVVVSGGVCRVASCQSLLGAQQGDLLGPL